MLAHARRTTSARMLQSSRCWHCATCHTCQQSSCCRCSIRVRTAAAAWSRCTPHQQLCVGWQHWHITARYSMAGCGVQCVCTTAVPLLHPSVLAAAAVGDVSSYVVTQTRSTVPSVRAAATSTLAALLLVPDVQTALAASPGEQGAAPGPAAHRHCPSPLPPHPTITHCTHSLPLGQCI